MNGTQHTSRMGDGTTIAWSRRGSGPCVVLVHGITESSSAWQPVADRLADDFEVITIDLRGHGRSSRADDYGLAAMAGDVATVIGEAEVEAPSLVGHSLGGIVVSAVGAVVPVSSVVNVDQSLRLDEFKEQLVAAEPLLRDAEAFPTVMAALFEGMAGELLSESERSRLSGLRRPDQDVVLGVWQLILEASIDVIAAAMDDALAGYAHTSVPYLSLFGMFPGDDYEAWLTSRVPGAKIDVWPDMGHYPHLVAPERFVERLKDFWRSEPG